MVDRVQLTQTVYMNLGGQWQLVKSGSVIDVPSANAFAPAHITLLSPGETAGTLLNNKTTSVRNLRTG